MSNYCFKIHNPKRSEVIQNSYHKALIALLFWGLGHLVKGKRKDNGAELGCVICHLQNLNLKQQNKSNQSIPTQSLKADITLTISKKTGYDMKYIWLIIHINMKNTPQNK